MACGVWHAQVEELETRLAEKLGQLEQVALEAERERNEQRAALCETRRELERVTNELSAVSSGKAALGATRPPSPASGRLGLLALVGHLHVQSATRARVASCSSATSRTRGVPCFQLMPRKTRAI